jgi:hypothetical protein
VLSFPLVSLLGYFVQLGLNAFQCFADLRALLRELFDGVCVQSASRRNSKKWKEEDVEVRRLQEAPSMLFVCVIRLGDARYHYEEDGVNCESYRLKNQTIEKAGVTSLHLSTSVGLVVVASAMKSASVL